MPKFRVDGSFILVFLIIFLSPQQGLLLKLMGALLIHEFGHLLILLIVRVKIKSLTLYAVGFMMELQEYPKVWWKDLSIYSAGILVNLFCFLVIPDPTMRMISLGLCLLNLVPIYPLDGFQIVKVLMEYHFPVYPSFLAMLGLSVLGLVTIIVVAIAQHFDLFIYFNILYLLYLNYHLWCHRKILHEQFLLYKYLHPYSQKKKKVPFHEHYQNFIYRYHCVILLIGQKEVEERELLEFHYKMKKNNNL